MSVDPELVGKGLGARLAALATALERYDAFAFRPGEHSAPPGGPGDQDADEAALALVLRAVRAASDPQGWQVLDLLARGDATTAQVAAVLATPRVVAWEQVNDLVQVGLVGRELDGDRLGLTEAGMGVVELIRELAVAAARAVRT